MFTCGIKFRSDFFCDNDCKLWRNDENIPKCLETFRPFVEKMRHSAKKLKIPSYCIWYMLFNFV